MKPLALPDPRKPGVREAVFIASTKLGDVLVTVKRSHLPESYDVTAIKDGNYLGWLSIGANRHDAEMWSAMIVSVGKEDRRKGIATALYDTAHAAGMRPIIPDYQKIGTDGQAFWARQRAAKIGQKPRPVEWRPTQKVKLAPRAQQSITTKESTTEEYTP